MNILYLNGDFFDQLSEYIFLRCCEILDKEEVFIDDTYFYSEFGYDKIELFEVFPNLKLKMLKDKYSAEEWDSMVSKCLESSSNIQIPNILEEKEGLEFKVVPDENFYNTHVNHESHGGTPKIDFSDKYDFKRPSLKVTANLLCQNWYKFKPFKDKDTGYIYPNIYYLGKWQHNDFPIPIKKQLKEELKFKPFEHEENIKHAENIMSKNGSIGIHINSKVFFSFESIEVINTYSEAMKKLRREVMKNNGTPAFFFFCDNISECEEVISQFNINPIDEIFYIETDSNFSDTSNNFSNELSFDFGFDDDLDSEQKYFSLQILTYCDYLIAQFGDYEPLLASCISENNKQFIALGQEKTPMKKPVRKPSSNKSKGKRKKK